MNIMVDHKLLILQVNHIRPRHENQGNLENYDTRPENSYSPQDN